MKLHVLGCSSIYPNGGQATSGYVVETAAGRLLLECGHDVVSKLIEHYSVRHLTAAVITHMHPDHYCGLFALGNLLLAEGHLRLPLFLPPGGLNMFYEFAERMGFDNDLLNDCFEASEYAPSCILNVTDLSIHMKRTKHPVNTFAMRFVETSSNHDFVFTSDTGWFEELFEFCQGANLLLTEATDYPLPPRSESVRRWHMTPVEAGRLIKDSDVGRAVITHYDARFSDAILSLAQSASSHQNVSLAGLHEEYSI